MAYYLDTSAVVKLVVSEPETQVLEGWIAQGHDVVSCDLLRTELLRATRRSAPDRMVRARLVLDSITLVTVAATTFERAADLDPGLLRSLDAIHLAAALEFGDELDGMVTYDDRLAEAARLHGIPVIAPGR